MIIIPPLDDLRVSKATTSKIQKTFFTRLNPTQIQAVHQYVHGSSQIMHYLKSRHSGSGAYNQKLEQTIQALTSIDYIGGTNKTLYRGEVYTRGNILQYLKTRFPIGKEYENPYFMSTSINPEIAINFARSHMSGFIIVMESRNGFPISIGTGYSRELEYLFLPNSFWKVEKHETVKIGNAKFPAVFLKDVFS